MKTLFPSRLIFFCVSIWFSFPSVQAAPATFTIDPASSSLTLSGSFQGAPFSSQSAGSLTDSYAGTITGDISGSTITFSGGSSITAQAHPNGASFTPAGVGVTNYGAQVAAIPGQVGALRNIVLDLTGGTASDGVAGSETLAFTSGKLDYAGPATGNGSLSLVNLSSLNSSTTPVSLITAGQVQTLTLPIAVTFDDGSGVIQTYTGSIVSLRTIPEPSSGVLLVCLAGCLAGRRVRN
jgi:hypothetical protein